MTTIESETPKRFLENMTKNLIDSISLFSGECNFKNQLNQIKTLEERRENLIKETLKATNEIFNESLKLEEFSINYIHSLITQTKHQRSITRSKSSSKKSNNQISNLKQTPLNSLYFDSDLEINDELIWKQIKLKKDCVISWLKEVLDEEDLEEIDEDFMAANRKEALGLSPDDDEEEEEKEKEEEKERLFDLDEMDLDEIDQSSIDDVEEEDYEEEEEEEEEKKSIAYITNLNDQESSSSSSESINSNEPSSSSIKKLSKTSSIDKLESRTSSKPKLKSNELKSKIDDNFFSLNEFEEEIEQGEIEMRRKLRKLPGENGEPEDEGTDEEEEEDVDLFSGFDTGILHDEDISEEDDGSDEDKNAMDLDMVANLRYGDFFDPPISLSNKKPKPKPIDKKTLNKKKSDVEKSDQVSKKNSRVKFSEKVIVKEIPANNKGIRVSDMSSGLDDEEEEDESEGSISLSDSEEEEEGSEEDDSQEESEPESESDGSEDAETKTMKRMSTDLFSDGFSSGSGTGTEEEEEEEDPSNSKSNESKSLSKHSKKLKLLSKQIAELEAENVAKKNWTLKGEVKSNDRPKNSLLEEDLEFEHIQKIVPQITEEKTLGLESLIKQRILDGQFDDVIKRRPIDLKSFLPSRLIELQDTKSNKSLTETYEEEYQREKSINETGIKPKDEKDEKLEKTHQEILEIYEDLFGKLDALSNAHFTPKTPKTFIKTINNLPTIALESALPTSIGTNTLLTPEELYSINPKQIQLDFNQLNHQQKQNQRKQNKLNQKKTLKKIENFTGKQVISKEEKLINKMSIKEQKDHTLKTLSQLEGITLIGNKRNLGVDEGISKNKKSRKLHDGSTLKL